MPLFRSVFFKHTVRCDPDHCFGMGSVQVWGTQVKGWSDSMAISDVFTIVGLIALVAFVVFAFRQGNKVKPSGNDTWPNTYL